MNASLFARLFASWKPPHIADPARRVGLWYSFLDGLCAMAMVGLLETHAMAALISLHASKFELALMGSLPLFLSALVQLVTPAVSAKVHSRKRIVLWSVWTQCICLFLLAFTGYVAHAPALVFVLLYAAYAMSGSFGAGVWSSWFADLMPAEIRGQYCAWRNRYFSIAQVSVGLLSGMIVHRITHGLTPHWKDFMAILLTALVCRVCSSVCLAKQYEPPLTFQPVVRDFTYLDFLLKAPTSNFARFTLFVGLIHGATAVSGPFFSKYFLSDLHLPYATFAFVTNAHLIGTLLFLPFWGKVADRYGNWWVVRVAATGIALIPVPYLWLAHPFWLWWLGFAAGALWSGFGLATFNYLLDTVTPPRRVRCSAYLGATVGFCVFAGGMAGGWLAYHLPPLWFWRYSAQTLFALSALLRLAAVAVFVGFGLVREIRHVKPVSPAEIFAEFPGVRLSLDFVRNTYRALRRI
ncbi:MAG: MFS transporter [bacterium]|nr:MFS transporter [bacterium]